MTIENAKRTLTEWCKEQIGYHEGDNNYNRYAASGDWDERFYGFSADNVPWCDVFADAAYITCFGFEDGARMTYQYPHGYAACSLSANAYRNNGAFYKTPEVGDQVFFYVDGDINHTGIVVAVNDMYNTFQCVEGNSSDSVAYTSYTITNPTIAGFGRPDWSIVETSESDEEQSDVIHPQLRRTYLHLELGDGVGDPKEQVRVWQQFLLWWGMDLSEYGADGEYGHETYNATLAWQRKVKEIGGDVEINGVVDEDDWVEIINVPG